MPGIRVYLQNPPSIRIGGMNSRSLYSFAATNPTLYLTPVFYIYMEALSERLSRRRPVSVSFSPLREARGPARWADRTG